MVGEHINVLLCLITRQNTSMILFRIRKKKKAKTGMVARAKNLMVTILMMNYHFIVRMKGMTRAKTKTKTKTKAKTKPKTRKTRAKTKTKTRKTKAKTKTKTRKTRAKTKTRAMTKMTKKMGMMGMMAIIFMVLVICLRIFLQICLIEIETIQMKKRRIL